MPNYTQNSVAYLINCSLSPDGTKTIDFPNETARNNYYSGIALYTANNCTYIRKDNILSVEYNADFLDTNGINYVMYNNPEIGENRWFFAFVTAIEYRAMKTAYLHLKTDVFTTYQFDIVKNNCFVEREHVSNDSIGAHTLPEAVPVDNYQFYKYTYNNTHLSADTSAEYANNYLVNVVTADQLNFVSNTVRSGWFLSGMIQPYFMYFVTPSEIISFVREITTENPQTIIGIYPVPQYFIQNLNTFTVVTTPNNVTVYIPKITTITKTSTTITQHYDFSGYTPKNNKLYTYPYRYITMTDYNGQNKILKYELLGNNIFNMVVTLGVNPSFAMYPDYYGGKKSIDSGLITNGFNPIPYITDSYQEYLALNQNSLNFNFISDIGHIFTSTIKGDLGGAVDSAIGAIGRAAELADRQKIPDSPHAIGGGSLLTYSNNLGVDIFDTTVDREYAEIIDNYFTMYGYAVNITKIPQWDSRENWNYIKTIDCNFSGKIPMSDKQALNDLFNNGITIWHKPEKFGKYDGNNNIV